MAIAVDFHLGPTGQFRWNVRQGFEQVALSLGKACQRFFVGGTVATVARRAQYPLRQLRIGITQSAELA